MPSAPLNAGLDQRVQTRRDPSRTGQFFKGAGHRQDVSGAKCSALPRLARALALRKADAMTGQSTEPRRSGNVSLLLAETCALAAPCPGTWGQRNARFREATSDEALRLPLAVSA